MVNPEWSLSESQSRSFVAAFARGLDVIQAFDGTRRPLSLSEVADTAQVDRAVARRMLLTLCSLGFASLDGGRFMLTPKILRLGFAYFANFGLEEIARPLVARLSRDIAESCSVSVLDDLETVSILNVPADERRVGFLLKVGSRWPAYVMASGRVLLSNLTNDDLDERLSRMELRSFTCRTLTDIESVRAEIEATRARGYARVDEELEEGLVSLAMPIRDRTGRVIASLNASSNVSRRTIAEFEASVVPAMKATAAEIGQLVRSTLA